MLLEERVFFENSSSDKIVDFNYSLDSYEDSINELEYISILGRAEKLLFMLPLDFTKRPQYTFSHSDLAQARR